MRVLHGFASSANQPYTLASIQRQAGIDSISAVFGESARGFSADLVVDVRSPRDIQRFFAEYASTFDIVHFHATWPFRFQGISASIAGALLALKANGVKVVYHFRGSEARLPSEFYKLNIGNGELPNGLPLNPSWPESKVRRNIDFWTSVADMSLAVDQELQTYVPHSRLFPRAVPHLGGPGSSKTKKTRKIIVAHAPTDQRLKGSAAFVQASTTSDHPDIELRLLPLMDHQELLDQIRDVDLVVDQFRLGWFGVFSIEAMALSKPVMAYIRPDLLPHLPSAGIIPTSIDSFEADLTQLTQLGEIELARLGKANLHAWEENYSPQAIQNVSHELYEEVLTTRGNSLRYLDFATLCQPEGLFTAKESGPSIRAVRKLALKVARALLNGRMGPVTYRTLRLFAIVKQ